MALVTIATVAIVLGWVVVGRISWCRRGGRRIQANDTATFWRAVVVEHDGSADETVFASKILQESGHRVCVRVGRNVNVMIIQRASPSSRCVVRALQGVEDGTHVVTFLASILNDVSVLVDSHRDYIVCLPTHP